ncbi:MAG: ferredoxin reductase [Actinobacteria bacterium]|nr:ferredoxin reductase [Actinomycetota bacterium]
MGVFSVASAPLKLGKRVATSRLVESLVTPNPIERYVELFDPGWARDDVRAEIVAVVHQTSRSVTLTLRPNANWRGFSAGQHVGVGVRVDGVLHTRMYSPASSALRDDGLIELTVSEHSGGTVSRHLIQNARRGMVVPLTQAEGEFVLPSPRPGSVLLISGGSGITPVMSMLRTLCDENDQRPITFLHYARTPADQLYAEVLDELAENHGNLRVLTAFTRAPGGNVNGRFSMRHLKAAGVGPGCETFACGPGSLVEAVESVWSKHAIKTPLHVERFTPPPPVKITAKPRGKLLFARSGLAVKNSGESILTQAEAAGLRPTSGCRMGICHTCIVRVDAGSVRHLHTGEVKDVAGETVQICVNAPVGDVAIEL